MKQVQTRLAAIFWSDLALAALLVALFESGAIETGFLAGTSTSAEFTVTIIVQLLTLATIPLSLKLFKLKSVHTDLLANKQSALARWGVLRLMMLAVLLVGNTLLYYIYMNTSFAYMALAVVLCLPFVYPSMDRCLSETEEEA